MTWLTININPPKLDVSILARTEDKFGYGPSHKVFEFDSSVYNEDEAAEFLESHSYKQWMEIPQ